MESYEYQGLYRAADILSVTTGVKTISQGLRDGLIVKIGKSWFTRAEDLVHGIDTAMLQAAKNNMLVGCLSACAHWGLWVPPTIRKANGVQVQSSLMSHLIQSRGEPHRALSSLEVDVNHLGNTGFTEEDIYACENLGADAKSNSELVVHRQLAYGCFGNHKSVSKSREIIVPLIDAIEQVVRYHDAETSLIVIESAISQGRLNPSHVTGLVKLAQRKKQCMIGRALTGIQSGSETRVRSFLESRKVIVRPQVYVADVGRVDLLVGWSLIVECDSQTFHSKELQVSEDRRRDQQAMKHGYTVLRLSYRDIWYRWAKTKELLVDLIRRRAHRHQIFI